MDIIMLKLIQAKGLLINNLKILESVLVEF